ncbi:MAG: hypothetical protein V4736_01135 [Bdellovibrionota bacterium]
MNDIVCLHRPRNINPISADSTADGLVLEARASELVEQSWANGLPLWSTCQREIIVTDLVTAEQHHLFSRAQNSGDTLDQVYTGSDAYQFLLEVISGLHSKLIGETEILGQFKTFLTSIEKDHNHFYKMHLGFFQSLLTDTKKQFGYGFWRWAISR